MNKTWNYVEIIEQVWIGLILAFIATIFALKMTNRYLKSKQTLEGQTPHVKNDKLMTGIFNYSLKVLLAAGRSCGLTDKASDF